MAARGCWSACFHWHQVEAICLQLWLIGELTEFRRWKGVENGMLEVGGIGIFLVCIYLTSKYHIYSNFLWSWIHHQLAITLHLQACKKQTPQLKDPLNCNLMHSCIIEPMQILRMLSQRAPLEYGMTLLIFCVMWVHTKISPHSVSPQEWWIHWFHTPCAHAIYEPDRVIRSCLNCPFHNELALVW
jgi:hypothetical protein